jgi:hypothetical protein
MHYSPAACQPVHGSVRQRVKQAQEKSKTEDFPHEDGICNSTQRSAGDFDWFPGSGVGL